MPISTSYLLTTKNLSSFFDSLITAQAPTTFTQKFLENLGYKSTNDRLFIGMLKSLGFLDASSKPTERYYKFLDSTQSKLVLAEAVQNAYSDLFAIKVNAQELSVAEVKNKLRTLTQGKPSDRVLSYMANTFKALCNYAEWSAEKRLPDPDEVASTDEVASGGVGLDALKTQLHYNIQIHLPESRDPAVYDALFKSLRRHLF